MKIIKKLCLFFAVLCLLAGCSNEDADDEYDGRNPVQFAAGNIAQPRTTAGGSQWAMGDQVGIFMLKENAPLASGNIVDNADNKLFLAQVGNNVTSGFRPSGASNIIYYPQNGDKVDFVAYYPYTTPLTNYKLVVDVSNQTDPSKIDILYSDNAKGYDKNSSSVDLQFNHAMSKLSFTLTAGVGVVNSDLTGATIEVSKLYRKADFDLVDGSLSNLASMGTVEANALSAIVIPQITDNSVLTITLTNGDYFEWNFPPTTNFEKGKNHPYTITVDRTGITVSTGNINDWNSSEAVTEGDTAIRYRVGDYYPEPNNASTAIGIVYWLKDPQDSKSKNGKIVSLDEGPNLKWSTETVTTNATSTADGKANMTTIKAISGWQTKYPAFKWCDAKGDHWYLPALDELSALYNAYNTGETGFNAKLTAGGGVELKNSWYWSSSERDGTNARIVYFGVAATANGRKSDGWCVRAVSAF